MVWVYFAILLIFVIAGVALAVFTLPGLWLMTASAAVYALVTHRHYVGWRTLIIAFVISLVAEILEMTLGGAAAKQAGGGKRAVVGAIVGGVLGGIFLSFLIPVIIVGTLVGICLGSFLGAGLFEWLGGSAPLESLKVGLGAAKGRFMGIVIKLSLGVILAIFIIVAALPIHPH